MPTFERFKIGTRIIRTRTRTRIRAGERGRRVIFAMLLVTLGVGFAECRSVPIQPPTFDYELLARRYLDSNRREHFPLTVQRGSNSQPTLTILTSDDILQIKNRMFYTTNRGGSRDIWMRDLDSTVNIPVIEHPAEQYAPAITTDGQRLAYVSEDRDPRGDIRIVSLKPGELIEHTLEGGAAVNLWEESTLKLSEEIEKRYRKGELACRGRARETAPLWHPAGRYLLFVSDRCTAGRENLWRARQDGLQLKIEQLTTDGAVMPAFSGDGRRIAFVSYRRPKSRGEIYLRDEASGRTIEVDLPRGPAADRYLYLYPVLSADGSTLYYVSVREDTNGNGYLDPDDFGAIFKKSLPADPFASSMRGRETQLVENSSRLFSLSRGFLEDSILYSAERAGSVNIYMTLKDGVVPRQDDIAAQYRLAHQYRDAGLRRYFLSLDAVRFYFGETLEFLVYEGALLVDRLRATPASSAGKRRSLRGQLDSLARENSFARLQRERMNPARAPAATRAFIAGLEKRPSCNARCRLMKSAALELAAGDRRRAGDDAGALGFLRRLRREDPGYFRIQPARRIAADLELKLTGKVPGDMIVLHNSERIKPKFKERILTRLYSFYYIGRTPADVLRLVEPELTRKDLPGPMRAALLLARGRARYDLANYEGALKDARTALGFTNANSGLFVQAHQLIAFVEERRGNFEAAFRARRSYAEVKSPEAGARLDPAEYREILQEFERRIDVFLRDARALAAVVEEREREDFDKPDEVVITVGGLRERIVEFCREDSYSFAVYSRLGPKFLQRYRTFCSQIEDYRAGNTDQLTLAQVMDGTEIFYQAATADANLLNIVFFNLRKANLFDDLYDRYAVYYHRRKVEIVQERSRHQVEWQKNRFRILQNLEGFVQDEDPFDEGAFNEILNGYGTALPFARDFGDLAMIYGAAYALIQRSLERERLYDSILEEGALPPDDSLQARKEALLRDFKTADYHLQYILYVDPAHVDAYLLRGWLYEYLEYRRGLPLKRKPTFYTRAFNFVTFTSAPAVSEGDFYADAFDAYFPDRLYEENVEWYRQALERLALRGGRDRDRASLRLNLGNNYFHLLNFKRALENYRKALELGGEGLFNGYRMKAVFHYNRGRSLYYEGRSRQAATEFKKAYDLYEENERKPLHRQYADLVFALEGRDIAEGQGDVGGANWKRRRQLLAERIDDVRVKMALLAALIGLSRWEAGQYDAAIRSYRDARDRLYGERSRADRDGDEELKGAVEDTALLNFIALAFQNKRDLVSSDRFARRAATLAEDQGLGRDDRRYRPGTLGGRLLGCFINYGEDFSVIGEGRNPYGFAPLRHYHLALGIQLENMILRGDMAGARALLKKRRAVFEKRDGDVQLGQIGAINTLSQEAFARYLAGEYVSAGSLFLKAAERAGDVGSLGLFERNFYNHFHALFARFERDPPPARAALDRIGRAREEISSFRESYRERAKVAFVAQKKIENPEFEYIEEEHDAALDDRVRRDIVEADAIRATLSYYAGVFGEQLADSPNELEAALADYRRAADRFDQAREALGAQFGVDSPPVFRARINRAQSLVAVGDLLGARRELENLAEKSFEFNLGREDWEIRWRLARLLDRIARRYDSGDPRAKRLREEIEEHLDRALASAAADRPRPPMPDGPIEEFYEFAAGYYLRADKPGRALLILERQWERFLQQEYLRYPLSFADQGFHRAYQRYRHLRSQEFALARAEEELRLRRRDIGPVRKQQLELKTELEASRKELLRMRPAHRPFVVAAGVARPRLNADQSLLRMFWSGSGLNVWKFKANRPFSFFRVPVASAGSGVPVADHRSPITRAVEEAFTRGLESESTAPVLVVDYRLFALPLESIQKKVRPDLSPPRFAGRVTADHRPLPVEFPRRDRPPSTASSARPVFFSYNQRRTTNTGDYETADLIVTAAPGRGSGVFTVEGDGFPFRDWLQRDRIAAAVFFARPESDERKKSASAPKSGRRFYRRQAASFEVLRAAGTGSAAFGRKQAIDGALAERGRRSYPRDGLRVFGAPGPGTGNHQAERRRMAAEALAIARRAEQDESFDRAVRNYGLAASLYGRVDRSRPHFEARLGMLRAGLRGSPETARTKFNGSTAKNEGRTVLGEDLSETVVDLEKDFPGQKNEIREEVVGALYLEGRPDLARAFLKKFPVNLVRTPTRLLEFLTRLGSPRYGKSDYTTDFARARPHLQRHKGDPDFIEDFLRHARHADAARILESLPAATVQGRLARLREEIQVDRFLLIPGSPRPAAAKGLLAEYRRLPNRLEEDPGAPDVLESDSARNGTEKSSNLLSRGFDKFRSQLSRAFLGNSSGGDVALGELGDVADGGGRTAYSDLSRMERAALVRVLIASLRDQPRGDTSARLRKLVQIEGGYGRERAAWMSLSAARAYLNIEEPAAARLFFRSYIRYEKDAIPDPRRRSFGARLGLALLSAGLMPTLKGERERLEQVLRDGGRGDFANLIRRLPDRLDHAGVQAFAAYAARYSRAFRDRSRASDVLLGVRILKYRARKEQQFAQLLNLTVWAEQLRFYGSPGRNNAGRLPVLRINATPEYSDVAGRIAARVPDGQAFVALVDTGGALMRLRLNGKRFAGEDLPHSSLKLRRQLGAYLAASQGQTGKGQLDRQLSRLYRSFVAAGAGQMTYYWASGVHALAPINLERGDRIFQVLDPNYFARKSPHKPGRDYRNGFRVRVIDERRPGSPARPARQVAMERVALGLRGNGPPFHRVGYRSNSGESTRGVGAYFFVPAPVPPRRFLLPVILQNQAAIRFRLAREFGGPGVYTVHVARGQAHPFFLKYFYSRATPISSLLDRYHQAYFHQKRRFRGRDHIYGYRLVTDRVLVE